MRVTTLRSTVVVALLATIAAPGLASAQGAPKLSKPKLSNAPRERLDKLDHAERLKRIALTGDLGLPMLPPVYADSPKDDILYIDRFPYGLDESASPGDGGEVPPALDGFLPAGPNGTGTTIPEIFKFLLPPGYEQPAQSEGLPPVPMVIAYHGYGGSANSVALLSTVDEECYERGWAYLSVTGMDDQLFGNPACQQNSEAAIKWMLNNFNIDEDRLYMVGFSMGGGVVSNFTARRRDPDGLMIAAIGVVSGTFDWTMTWKLGNQQVKTLLQSSFNFGGPPTSLDFRFRYQQASDIYYNINTYPPLLNAQLLDTASMATNLGTTPTYIVWDTDDTLVEVTKQEPIFHSLLLAQGGIVEYHTVTGTLNPSNGEPAPHSWAVLDEDALFDFFQDKVVDRTPESFHALMDQSGQVSWLSLEQRFLNNFSIVDGNTDPEVPYVTLANVVNAEAASLDMTLLGLQDDLVRVNAGASGGNFDLKLFGFTDPPAYLVDANTGDLVTGSESDPVNDTLQYEVSSSVGSLEALVITDPSWSTDLLTAPNPATIGTPITLTIDAPPTSSLVLLFIGFNEALGTISGGYHITLALGPPTIYIALGVDVDGNATLPATIPDDAVLVGLDMLLQTIGIGAGTGVDSISNLWTLHIE